MTWFLDLSSVKVPHLGMLNFKTQAQINIPLWNNLLSIGGFLTVSVDDSIDQLQVHL